MLVKLKTFGKTQSQCNLYQLYVKEEATNKVL